MKYNFTLLCLTIFFTFIFSVSFAQTTGDYRTVNAPKSGAGGTWSTVANWERYNGTAWVAAVAAPTSADGVITISANDSIRLDVNVTVDQVVVTAGAALDLNIFTYALTLNNGTGDDLVVNGSLYLNSLNSIIGPGTMLINGTFNWLSGTLDAPTTTSAASVTNLSTASGKNLNDNFTNNGTFNWVRDVSGGGILFTDAIFTNNGTINEAFLASGGMLNVSGTNAFINNGTFNKTTSFTFFNTNVPFTNAGVLKGSGTYSLSAPIANNGIIAPGNAPGSGILAGNSLFVDGQVAAINIDVINGSGAGVGHDRLDLDGTVNLSTLTLNVLDPGTAPIQSYTILSTTGSFTGTFANVSMPNGFTITYNATSVVVNKISFPLPAVWGDFTALAKNNKIDLKWTTLQEINTSSFAVEYAVDGKNFKPVATVSAKGNAAFESNYVFTHTSPNLNGSNFYRIALTDQDGSKSFSPVRIVKFSENKLKLLVALPNPVLNTIQLSAQEKMEIRLMDVNGKMVKKQIIPAGNSQVDVTNLQPGIYILDAYSNGQKINSQKMIKQ